MEIQYIKQPLTSECTSEPGIVEVQCEGKNPLAKVKRERSETVHQVTVETLTFPRKELYLSVASCSGAEQIHLPVFKPEPKPLLMSANHTQTVKSLIECFTKPIKRQLEPEIREVNKKIKMAESAPMNKDKFMTCCEKYLNEHIVEICKLHLSLHERSKGNRYGFDFKTFALNCYLSNPSSYKFFERMFNLPAKVTLKRLQIPAGTGVNPILMEYLKVKVNKMTEKEKVCAICFDSMRVSKNLWYEVQNDFFCGTQEIDQVMGPEPAEYSALLMVRGLYTKWTQPVSFALMAEKRCYPELKEWMHKIIGLMLDIGLNIKAFVCDLETEFMDVFVRPESHYFEIDERKIYCFYDVRYLFRSARNELMQSNFHVGTKVTKWSHILKVYDKDKSHDLSLMPKITDEHVRPAAASLSNADLAIQVFSGPVAAAMNFHVVAKMAPPKIKDTVEFIAKMSDLYDILSSRTMASAYKGTTEQNEVLSDILEYLQALEVKDKHGNVLEVRFVTGLIVNIRSAMALLESLKEENIHYLLTDKFRKDCSEELFAECRRTAGNCVERPTSIMFARSFRRHFLASLVSNAKYRESDQDLKSTLNKIAEYVKVDVRKKDEATCEPFFRMCKGVNDYKIPWVSTEFVAGYLLSKCLERHKCSTFIEKLSTLYDIPVESDAATLIRKFRKYNAENADSIYLTKPPESLVNFVDSMDQKFREYYARPERQTINFGLNTYRFIEEDTFELPCECFPLKFFKSLFIRVKIEHCVRDHNKKFRSIRRHMYKEKNWRK